MTFGNDEKHPPMTAGLWVWGFAAALYLLGFFHRVAPGVITAELMRDFAISAGALGNLSAFYFYSYAAMQIPTGILVDRWGPRRLLTTGALVAAGGAVLFALAPGVGWAAAGRLLIGGSVAVAFVGSLKVSVNWFAPRHYALLSGMASFFGVTGAVFAGTPLRLLVDHYGWRAVVLVTAAVTLLVGVGTWWFVRDQPHEKGFDDFVPPRPASGQDRGGIVADILRVFAYRNTVLLFLIPGGITGCVLTFCGLWGVPYLQTLHGVSATNAAAFTSALLVAWAVGGPFFGWLSERACNRKAIYLAGCGASLSGWLVVVLVKDLPLIFLLPVMVATGFCSGCMVITFVFVKESVPLPLAGTASGVINMGVMAGPMLLQPAVGRVLDLLWSGEMAAGVRVYSLSAYRSGFALMLAWIALSFFLLLFTRDTGCRQLVQ